MPGPILFSDIEAPLESILFCGQQSYKIVKIIEKEENVKVSFYTKNKLKNKIFNTKDKIQNLDKSGIYNITVPDHGEYIGKTSRAIKTRIKEHYASVHNQHPDKSGFANYMVENNIPTNICSVKVLHSNEPNPRKLDLLETYYIRKACNDPDKVVFNSQLEKKETLELVM
ncbi:hypothetical protein WDU94_010927 [Cyamophila willieti]